MTRDRAIAVVGLAILLVPVAYAMIIGADEMLQAGTLAVIAMVVAIGAIAFGAVRAVALPSGALRASGGDAFSSGRLIDGAIAVGTGLFVAVAGMLIEHPGSRWLVMAGLILIWLGAWLANAQAARAPGFLGRFLPPVLFGITLLAIWEISVRGFAVPQVILPAPSVISAAIVGNVPTLWADFVQTVLRSVLPGFAMGCGAAFVVAIAIDRSPFLQRGLLPIGNLAAALPIVGIAPIAVMWFGFDWQSKAAVVVLMCFFPMLVNTMEGLRASEAMQRDLMRTYAASYWQSLFKLRLPAAMPFVFNGLKICSTLALIGAIVAEFFGTPIVGMGFRISTEVGRLALDMVWAEITVAAVTGSAFYGLIVVLERAATFWHPSIRS